jgi:hypothetical protein
MDHAAPLSPADVRRRPTATLEQLLRDFDAPRVIDYLCASAPSRPAPPRSPALAVLAPACPRHPATRAFCT